MARPMLLTDYAGPASMQWPAWVERKYDGVRCVIVVDDDGARAISREGLPLAAGQAAADWIAARGVRGLIDGELVGATFRRTLSAIKRNDPEYLRLKVWDYLTLEEVAAGRSDRQLAARRAGLVALMPEPSADAIQGPVDLVSGCYVADDEALERVYRDAMRRRWEGLVAKDPCAPYVCGTRSRGWRRCKPGEGA